MKGPEKPKQLKRLTNNLPPIPWALWQLQPRADESMQRVREAVRAFFSSELDDANFVLTPTMDQAFVQIAQQYWSEHDRDHQPNRTQINGELRRLRGALTKTLAIMDALTRGASLTITMSLSRRNDNGELCRDSLLARQKLIRDLNDKVTILLADKYVKSTGRKAVRNACISLTKCWEQLIGRRAKRQPKIDKWERRPDDFTNLDARFIFTVLNALDPTITTSNLRSALQSGGWGRKKAG